MTYFDAFNQLDNALVEHNRKNGGLLTLLWEELNEVSDGRDSSPYTDGVANDLLSQLQALLKYHLSDEDFSLLQVQMDECGLCINIPPIPEDLVQQADEIIRASLSQEDMETVLWDDCTPDGKLFW